MGTILSGWLFVSASVELLVPDLSAGSRLVMHVVVAVVALVVLGMVVGIFAVTGRQAQRLARSQKVVAFEGRLSRALQLAQCEEEVCRTTMRALAELAPEQPASILLADASNAHLRAVLETGAHGADAPATPRDCPAARTGQRMVFPDSTALDACGRLACANGCSASCHPVAINGRTVGVLSVLGTVRPGRPELLDALDLLSHKLGDRLTVLRAMAEKDTQARTDPLTGLLNRRRFDELAEAHLRAGRGYAIAYADLDRFKRLNDTHGHAAGDQALRRFAQVLKAACPEPLLAARHGGEEFVVCLPDHDLEAARAWADGLREALATRMAAADGPAFTVSVGIARGADDLDGSVRRADEALLRAKRTGRDRVVLETDPVVAYVDAA
ncbi:MAG: sensor domain-containing diguanylate cyclase [Myxococcales bacterium]|nr:sensor domain-containing diguanylate cyclase [Myxococcales bacterium]